MTAVIPTHTPLQRPQPLWRSWALATTIGELLGFAVPLLCTIGVAQAHILRRHIQGSGWWIGANVLGWLLGLPATFIIPALVPGGSPTAVWVATFIISGVLMGAIVGATTGLVLQRILVQNHAFEAPENRAA